MVESEQQGSNGYFSLRRTTEVVAGKLEIHEEKYSGKAWTVKVREVLEDLEKVGLYIYSHFKMLLMMMILFMMMLMMMMMPS